MNTPYCHPIPQRLINFCPNDSYSPSQPISVPTLLPMTGLYTIDSPSDLDQSLSPSPVPSQANDSYNASNSARTINPLNLSMTCLYTTGAAAPCPNLEHSVSPSPAPSCTSYLHTPDGTSLPAFFPLSPSHSPLSQSPLRCFTELKTHAAHTPKPVLWDFDASVFETSSVPGVRP